MQVQATGVQGSSENHRFATESDFWLRSAEDSNDDITAVSNELDAIADSNQR